MVENGKEQKKMDESMQLWYDRAAANWNEALPVGNGRIGAMVFGGATEEKLQLNEETIRTGGPVVRGTELLDPEAVRKCRNLLFAGKQQEANDALPPEMFRESSAYQPFGDLIVRSILPDADVTGYRRSLSLDDAVARTEFSCGGVAFVRETFASFTDDVVVHRLSADRKGAVAFNATIDSPHDAPVVVEGERLVSRGVTGASPRDKGGVLKFCGCVAAIADGGTVEVADGRIVVRGADSATIYVAMATNYRNFRDLTGDPDAKCAAALAKAMARPYAKARERHVAYYREQADRCTLSLGPDMKPEMPTDQRILDFARTMDDPYFIALYFRYGRYLLISSSQPGTEPANLQGIWNDAMKPRWNCNYTININTEMNYWPAESTALGDLAEPLWRMCRDLSVTGAEFARDIYGADGWVVHHNTDTWRRVSPNGSAYYGMWPSGGGWLVTHIWQHWLYTRDRDFLAEWYNVLKGCADFFASYMVRDPKTGHLTIAPSMSPENGRDMLSLTPSAAMDHQIARDVLRAAADATDILGKDAAYSAKLRRIADDTEPMHIGDWGQLHEWTYGMVDDPDDHHRHLSHLYAAFPSNQITPDTPELFEAAKVSLRARGDDSTGWALAWRMCLWTRLLDAEHAYSLFRLVFREPVHCSGSYPNLFDAHPPFQIDGNFGATAAIVEMAMQTHRGCIDLLPAMPEKLTDGSFRGLRAPGGFVVDIDWKDGTLVRARIRSLAGEPCKVRYAGKTVSLRIPRGGVTELPIYDDHRRDAV